MNFKIVTKDSFRIIGVKRRYAMDTEENHKLIPLFWREAHQTDAIEKLCGLMNKEPAGILGVCAGMDGKEFDYYIAVASDKPLQNGFFEFEVPACTWAIFECVGPMPNAIQELQARVMTEWLPASGYEYADAPDLEVYPEGDTSSPNYKCEVWLPVTKKA